MRENTILLEQTEEYWHIRIFDDHYILIGDETTVVFAGKSVNEIDMCKPLVFEKTRENAIIKLQEYIVYKQGIRRQVGTIKAIREMRAKKDKTDEEMKEYELALIIHEVNMEDGGNYPGVLEWAKLTQK